MEATGSLRITSTVFGLLAAQRPASPELKASNQLVFVLSPGSAGKLGLAGRFSLGLCPAVVLRSRLGLVLSRLAALLHILLGWCLAVDTI